LQGEFRCFGSALPDLAKKPLIDSDVHLQNATLHPSQNGRFKDDASAGVHEHTLVRDERMLASHDHAGLIFIDALRCHVDGHEVRACHRIRKDNPQMRVGSDMLSRANNVSPARMSYTWPINLSNSSSSWMSSRIDFASGFLPTASMMSSTEIVRDVPYL
jgi:hypothetical protein